MNFGLRTAFILLVFASLGFAQQQMPAVTTVPPAARASPNFDVETATEAYLAQMPAQSKARSDAYFEGGYWLILWDFLYGPVIAVLLLQLRWSAAMRNLAEKLTRHRALQTGFYWIEYPSSLASSVPRLPCTKATFANISTGWQRKPSAHGCTTSSRACW